MDKRVPIPQGVVVIDLDTYKGVTREQIEEHFGCPFPWRQAFVQKTLKGGEHYAFRVSAHVPQGDSLFGIDGFNIRTAEGGWICTGLGDDGGAVEKLSDIGSLPWLPFEVYPPQDRTQEDEAFGVEVVELLELILSEVKKKGPKCAAYAFSELGVHHNEAFRYAIEALSDA